MGIARVSNSPDKEITVSRIQSDDGVRLIHFEGCFFFFCLDGLFFISFFPSCVRFQPFQGQLWAHLLWQTKPAICLMTDCCHGYGKQRGGVGRAFFSCVYEQTRLLAKSNLTLTRWNGQQIASVTPRAGLNANILQESETREKERQREGGENLLGEPRSM